MEHLGEVVRIHFADIVRDVDLRAVMSDEERRDLEENPGLAAQGGTAVSWPNGARLDAAMLALIYQGFGERRGWPRTAPPMPADAPFSVSSLASAGAHPADWVQPTSTSLRRIEALQTMIAKVAGRAESLRQWWADDAHPQLVGELSSGQRRDLVGRARAEARLLQLSLDPLMEQLTQTAGLDAIAEGAPEFRSLVERAKRWNYVWADQEGAQAAAVFDPVTDPEGFREELRARLLSRAAADEEEDEGGS